MLIDWLGHSAAGKPKSRAAKHLKAKYPSQVGGGTTTRTHTGAAYESGEVNAARGHNDSDAARMCADNGEDI